MSLVWLGLGYGGFFGAFLAGFSQSRICFGSFAPVFIVKTCVFIGALPENGRVETKCLPFDENHRISSGKTVQRTVLYLGEINDQHQAAWRKSLAV